MVPSWDVGSWRKTEGNKAWYGKALVRLRVRLRGMARVHPTVCRHTHGTKGSWCVTRTKCIAYTRRVVPVWPAGGAFGSFVTLQPSAVNGMYGRARAPVHV